MMWREYLRESHTGPRRHSVNVERWPSEGPDVAPARIGPCAWCGRHGVDLDVTGADGESVCDECRDARELASDE